MELEAVPQNRDGFEVIVCCNARQESLERSVIQGLSHLIAAIDASATHLEQAAR